MDGQSSRSLSRSSIVVSIDNFTDYSIEQSTLQDIAPLAPAKINNPAQDLLDEISSDIGKLSKTEQKKWSDYAETCRDILTCLPGFMGTEDTEDTIPGTSAALSSTKRKRIELTALLAIEDEKRFDLADANPLKNKKFERNIQTLSQSLHEMGKAANLYYAKQEKLYGNLKAGMDRLVNTEKLVQEVETQASRTDAYQNYFNIAADAFKKAQLAHTATIKTLASENKKDTGITQLIQEIAAARDAIGNILRAGIKPLSDATADKLLSEVCEELDNQLVLLEMREAEFNNAVSTLSPAAVMKGRLLQVQAAMLVIDEIAAKYPGDLLIQPQAKHLKSQLIRRQMAMQKIIDGKKKLPNKYELDDLLGKAQLGSLEKKLFPKLARQQEAQMNILLKDGFTDNAKLIHPDITEKDLMLKFIDEYFMHLYRMRENPKDVPTLLERAAAKCLNQQRDWSVIDSSFTVPVASVLADKEKGGDNAKNAVVVETKTTPIGNVFEGAEVKVLSKDSPISTGDFSDYKTANPNDPSKKITTGRNSHSAMEGKHAVNLARSVCSLFGKVILSVSRHATLSPYKFSRSSLKSMPEAEALALMAHLGKIPTNITRMSVSENAANNDKETPMAMRQVDKDLLKAICHTIILHTGKNFTVESAEKLLASPAELLKLARIDQSVCNLLRRKAALNRAREVFLSEVTGNPDLLQRIADKQPISFNSFSLLTPDPLRAFFSKHFPALVPASDNEKRMLADQEQAWIDLQEELNSNALEINGQVVKAHINAMNIGVNPLALQRIGPMSRDLTGGWTNTHEHNEASIKAMIGEFGSEKEFEPGGRLKTELEYKQTQWNDLKTKMDNLESSLSQTSADDAMELRQEMENIERSMKAMKTLASQIAQIWQSESYQHGGREPYKLAARLAMLSSLMGEATVFNCKSGKDRTAQLDIELKFLAFQIYTSNGAVPKPDRKRTTLEKRQLAAFIFKDESRRQMQVYNTGVGGSKLADFDAMSDNFIDDPGMRKFIIKQFQGLSKVVKS